jgi:hypothetical protein
MIDSSSFALQMLNFCSFGLVFIARRWDDPKLIAAAYAFEQATLVNDRIEPFIKSDVKLRSTTKRSHV